MTKKNTRRLRTTTLEYSLAVLRKVNNKINVGCVNSTSE